MGESATPAILDACREAYEVLAGICIDRESEIYRELRSKPGGWNGFRRFVVDRKELECDGISSFYLRPFNGGQLPDFRPGQYVTVRIDAPGAPTVPRNYSLSDRPGHDYFRISVKKEVSGGPDCPAGQMSGYLHNQIQMGDEIELGPPCGEFTYDPNDVDDRPFVFLAGGIGITPLLSMARSLVHLGVLAPIRFLHAVKNSTTHPFRDEVQNMVSDKDFVETLFVYNEPLDDDRAAGRCDRIGLVDQELLRDWAPLADGRFFVCGPRPFMQQVPAALRALGVDAERIHFEFFGPKLPMPELAPA